VTNWKNNHTVYPYQARIVGREAIASLLKQRRRKVGHWKFLRELKTKLQVGQYIHMVVPKDISKNTIRAAWYRETEGKGHVSVKANSSDSWAVILWVKSVKVKEELNGH